MFSRSLFSAVLIRIVLIVLTSFAFVTVIAYLNNEYYLSLIGIGALLMYQVFLLVNFMNKTNRRLALFFSSVRNEDSVLRYSQDHQGKTFESLNASLDELNATISEIRRRNARQNIFLNNLVNHVGVGLISYTQQGNIEIFNDTAKELLQINQISKIQEISHLYPELHRCIVLLQPNEQQVLKLMTKQSGLFLSLKLRIFVSEKETVNLISLQNIRTELEHRELDSWQKLIRVLTHEISNSISPINSLANTTKNYFVRESTGSTIKEDEIHGALLQKTVDNLDTIETTGKGLIDFLGSYKSLTTLPRPKFENFLISIFFDRLQSLLMEEAKSNNISLKFANAQYDLELTADPGLLEMVLINLIKNAFEALNKTHDSEVKVSAIKNGEDRIIITVKDNGCGIPSDIIDDIFIPFYTTKEQGSGIGLSLSRQILRLHNGTITVSSLPDNETVFSLIL